MRNTAIITLFLIICTKAIPSYIEFEKSSYTYSINEQVNVKPKSTQFTGCTISPTPFAGLIFDPNTCSLTGVVTTPAPSTTYTVVTFMSGQTYTGSFSLEIVDGTTTIPTHFPVSILLWALVITSSLLILLICIIVCKCVCKRTVKNEPPVQEVLPVQAVPAQNVYQVPTVLPVLPIQDQIVVMVVQDDHIRKPNAL